MLAIRNIALLASAVLLISGCARAEQVDEELITQEPEASQTSTPTPSEPEESEPETPQPEACSQDVQEKIQETISLQTQAFANEEFELAYSFASPSFRASVDLRSFVGIISGSYGPLIASSNLDFTDCLMSANQDLGVIDVSFIQGGEDVYALRYLMVETPEGWRVQGASNIEVVGKGA
jgi:hypothetical protein